MVSIVRPGSNLNKTPHSNPSPVVVFTFFLFFWLNSCGLYFFHRFLPRLIKNKYHTWDPSCSHIHLAHADLLLAFPLSGLVIVGSRQEFLGYPDALYKTRSSNHLSQLDFNASTKTFSILSLTILGKFLEIHDPSNNTTQVTGNCINIFNAVMEGAVNG